MTVLAEPGHALGQEFDARRSRRRQHGGVEVVLEHHMGEGLVGRDLAVEVEEDGPGGIAFARIRDHHLDHGLGRGRHRLPGAEPIEEAARPGRHRDAAQGAGRFARGCKARIRHGHTRRRRGTAHRQREGQPGNAAACHKDVLRLHHGAYSVHPSRSCSTPATSPLPCGEG